MKKIIWPHGKKFAFSIVDDTDCINLENGPAVYDFLNKIGIRSTKTIWIYNGEIRKDNIDIIGDTCENKDYRYWVQSLQKSGFEIALHSISWSRSNREIILSGLELFKEYFGDYPKLLAQHNDLVENESLYWGRNRLTFPANVIYDLLALINPKSKNSNIYKGTESSSPYFWGDICKEKIKYVRNFVFSQINSLKVCPEMPYHDSSKPFVNKWFASTEAPEVNSFNKLLTKTNLDKLESQKGCCIIYTHFGKNFFKDGILNPEFVGKMKDLAKMEGWFVPASEILDFIDSSNTSDEISFYSRFNLELKWLYHKIRVGGTS
jgi:hypothetical protein